MNGAASFGDERGAAIGDIAAQRPAFESPFERIPDERDGSISGRRRRHIGRLLLADEPDAE